MAQAIREKPGFLGLLRGPLARGSREGALLFISAVAIYLLVSIASYDPGDPGWSNAGHVERIANRGGVAGAWFADVLLYLFGFMAYLFPVMIGYAGWLVYKGLTAASAEFDVYHATIRTAGCVLAVCAGCGLATLHYHGPATFPVDAGGIIGSFVGSGLAGVVNPIGGTLFLFALFLTGITLFTGLSWLEVMDVTGRYTIVAVEYLYGIGLQARDRWLAGRHKQAREARLEVERERKSRRKPPRIEPVIAKVETSVRVERERQVPLFEPAPSSGALPPLALLDGPKKKRKVVSDESLEAISRQVELKLADFGIEAEVVAVHPGPVVTRYELQLAPGLKVSRVTTLAKDLARSLSTVSVRIVEVIPGKTTIGLEIPNEEREIVVLSDVLKSSQYDTDTSHLALGLGKDISGHPVVVDLASMPHLLVAGTTGSGKSVAINAMILSLLYKASSSDVRMIMIDPKMLELSVYEGIPHLLAPVVTDMKHASNALRWCVVEMDRRYRLMSTLGVRNIGGYNRKVSAAADSGTPLKDPSVCRGWCARRSAVAREASIHRSHRRRACRHDDADRKEGRRADRTSRAEGARRGHPPHPRDPAAFRRRDHRPHQGEHPEPHRVSGVGEGGFPNHSRSDGRGAPARAWRHALSRSRGVDTVPRARRIRRRSRGPQGRQESQADG